MSPVPKYVENRREFLKKFPEGSRVISLQTKRVYIVVKPKRVRYCRLMGLNPMGIGEIDWLNALKEFELDGTL